MILDSYLYKVIVNDLLIVISYEAYSILNYNI